MKTLEMVGDYFADLELPKQRKLHKNLCAPRRKLVAKALLRRILAHVGFLRT